MPHGGRRPGAGAPRGNTNALRHGLYSRRAGYAALLFAATPEYRAALHTAHHPNVHPTLRRALLDAANIVLSDRELAQQIRQLTAKRLLKLLRQLQIADAQT